MARSPSRRRMVAICASLPLLGPRRITRFSCSATYLSTLTGPGIRGRSASPFNRSFSRRRWDWLLRQLGRFPPNPEARLEARHENVAPAHSPASQRPAAPPQTIDRPAPAAPAPGSALQPGPDRLPARPCRSTALPATVLIASLTAFVRSRKPASGRLKGSSPFDGSLRPDGPPDAGGRSTSA